MADNNIVALSNERKVLLGYVDRIRRNKAMCKKEDLLHGKYQNAYKHLLEDTKMALLRCMFMEYNGSLHADEDEMSALRTVCETMDRLIVKAMVIHQDDNLVNMLIDDGHRMYDEILERNKQIKENINFAVATE